MKVNILIKNNNFINFDSDLNLWERICLAYGVIRNFTINFNFQELEIVSQQSEGEK